MSSLTGYVEGVPGIVTGEQLAQSADFLAGLQTSSGQIPWFVGGHCDPWNHVEAAMALTVSGHLDGARAAYRSLARTQLGDGSWFNYYLADRVKDPRLDTNVCAYVATGLRHYLLATDDVDFAAELWPVVEAALDFVVRWRTAEGAVRWSLDGTGRPERYALLTGSSSVLFSVRCGVELAERFEHAKPDWEFAAARLAHAIAHHPGAFAPKDEFAMDWYYPILSGALRGPDATDRLARDWSRFVFGDYGVRCVSRNDWVTAAETSECVLALDALDARERALELFAATGRHRRGDGAYWTGLAYPGAVTFPHREATSYTTAAILLAADALSESSAAARLFRHDRLEAPLELAEADCSVAGEHAQ